MPQDGELSQQRRRIRPDAESQQEAISLPSYPTNSRRSSYAPRTDAPYADELLESPHSNTSVVRRTGPQGTSQTRANSLVPTNTNTSPVVPTRRQPVTKNTTTQQRQNRTTTTTTQPQKVKVPKEPRAPKPRRGAHWLFYVGVGMLAALVLWMVGSSALAWGVQRYNDLRYGSPRTFQMDAVVGHNDSPQHPSHFIAVNLNRQAIVVEFMGGDPAKSVSYVAPVYIAGDGGEQAPVTLEFRDVNGDGKLDMVIHIHLPSQDQVSVFVNDGTKFRPSNGNDKIRI